MPVSAEKGKFELDVVRQLQRTLPEHSDRMKAYVGITDLDWYTSLSKRPDLDEVNFWKPGGEAGFRALDRGGLFLFKLHAPRNFIVGGGYFGHFSRIPLSLAWEAFEEKNGVESRDSMRSRIAKYRKQPIEFGEDPTVGCILLEQPFFFPESAWIPAPADWSPSIQQGKTYDITIGIGRDLWDRIQTEIGGVAMTGEQPIKTSTPAYGKPTLVQPRLGQGTFRVLVTDNYARRCAITGERTLPVLEAAHIKPYSLVSEHDARNGLLLRSDIHTLFDRGYVTVTPDCHFRVSRRLKDDWQNGRAYYDLADKPIRLPESEEARPNSAYLQWHLENRFLA
jgi:putative restriction endonuclease